MTPTPPVIWPTPTLYPTSVATPAIQMPDSGIFIDAAEHGVGLWNQMNSQGTLATIQLLFLLVLIFTIIYSIIRQLQGGGSEESDE